MGPYATYYSGPLCRECEHPSHEYACETSERVNPIWERPGRYEDCPCEERAL